MKKRHGAEQIVVVVRQADAIAGTLELAARKLVVQLFPGGKSAAIHYDGRLAEVSF